MNKNESKKGGLFQKGVEMNYHEEPPDIDVEEFKKVVHSRRSIRIYDPNVPIPESVVRECLRLAILAPSSSNLQPWEFLWIRDKKKKELLAKACFSQLAAKTAQEMIVAVARTGTWSRNNRAIIDYLKGKERPTPPQVLHYYEKTMPFMLTQGFFGIFGLIKRIYFFFAGFFKVVPRRPSSKNDMKMWTVKSTALACQNLMLSFRAFGFDSCPMEGYDPIRVRKILALPSDAELVMIISAGKRAQGGVYGRRFRLDEKWFIKEI